MPLFVSDKSLKLWLDEYAVSHQNSINKRIHVICVPVIFLTIVALIINISLILMTVLAVGVLWFYLRLSHSLFGDGDIYCTVCRIRFLGELAHWGMDWYFCHGLGWTVCWT